MHARTRTWMTPLLGAALGCLAGAQASPHVAVVVAKAQKTLESAAEAIVGDPRVQATRFDLAKGTLEVDQLVDGIAKKRFEGIVALGREAHELVARVARGTPYASTLLGGADAGDHAVPELPSATSWAEVLAELLPRGAKVATVDTSGEVASYLGELRGALGARGLELVVHKVPAGKGVSSLAPAILASCQAFFFPRTRELLNRTAALAIFKGSGATKTPVFGFSESLLKVGATASLEIPAEMLGRRAVNQILGEGGDESPPRLRLNLDRATLLGITVPPAMQRRATR